MSTSAIRWFRRVCTCVGLATAAATGCADGDPAPHRPRPEAEFPAEVVVLSRTQMLESFPCRQCHRGPAPTLSGLPPRPPHRDLRFDHMNNVADCYLCHEPENLDQLRLIDGTTVSFDTSPVLCGQCHADVKRDWDLGIHGKQVGSWLRVRHRHPCAGCHDPHSPRRPEMTPYPPPPRPELGIAKKAHRDDPQTRPPH